MHLRPAVFLFICPFLFFCTFTLLSCEEDEDSYPPLVTELAMAESNAEGLMSTFTPDNGPTYQVINSIKGMSPNSRLRVLVSYVAEQTTTGNTPQASIYKAQEVPVLWDFTQISSMKRDPTGIQSAWLSGGYINLHLTPKTHGGKQAWGFTQDSVTTNALGTATHHLSLYHNQFEDATSYTTELYACIDLDSVATLAPKDSIRLTVQTFKGTAEWQFEH